MLPDVWGQACWQELSSGPLGSSAAHMLHVRDKLLVCDTAGLDHCRALGCWPRASLESTCSRAWAAAGGRLMLQSAADLLLINPAAAVLLRLAQPGLFPGLWAVLSCLRLSGITSMLTDVS